MFGNIPYVGYSHRGYDGAVIDGRWVRISEQNYMGTRELESETGLAGIIDEILREKPKNANSFSILECKKSSSSKRVSYLIGYYRIVTKENLIY